MATRADVITVLVLIGAFGALAPAALHGQERKAEQTRCGAHLTQLGLAALQYADDKRFFPHLGAMRELDGGYTTNAAPKVVRTLTWYAYASRKASFVCPATTDAALPVVGVAKENRRRWFWSQDYTSASVERSPLVDGAADPALSTTRELSYGWTRRTMNVNVRATALIAADRGRANHGDGWSVLQADGTVKWTGDPAAQATLVATTAEPTSGFLGLQGPDDPAPPGR